MCLNFCFHRREDSIIWSPGSDQGQFNNPSGVAINDDGNILVVDNNNHRIRTFSAYGRFKIHPQTKWIYVADQCNNRDPNLTFFSSFGSRGTGPGQLQHPWDVTFDSANNVYVADSSNNRIQVFNENGQYLRQIGRRGSGEGELSAPAILTIDDEDKVYVTDNGNHCVSVFTSDGGYLTLFGNGSQQFQSPCGITVDRSGMVYVCDYSNNRMQIFKSLMYKNSADYTNCNHNNLS